VIDVGDWGRDPTDNAYLPSPVQFELHRVVLAS
jgi:hypothetical protein